MAPAHDDSFYQQLIDLKGRGLTWGEVAFQTGLTSGDAARALVRRYKKRKQKGAHRPSKFQESPPEFHETGVNTAIATATGHIKTLSQLLEATQADLTVWKVARWNAKAWNVHAKAEKTHLTYQDGVVSGSTEKGGIDTKQLWSIWAEFTRIEPIAIFPTIQPIESSVIFKQPKAPRKTEIRRALILPDLHAWFSRDPTTGELTEWHDRRVMNLAIQIAAAAEVDRIDIIGDTLDMTDWSLSFWTSPDMRNCLQPAIIEIHWWLSQLRHARPNAEITIYEGNHEARMTKAIAVNLAAAYEVRPADGLELPPSMSIPRLLALHALKINWIGGYPDELVWLNKALCLCHGDIARGTPGTTARAMAERYNAKVIFGHVHRREWVTVTKHTQNLFAFAFCPGCMCHLDGRVRGVRGRQNWQQGIALADYEVDGGGCQIMPIEIEDGVAIWNGKRFVAKDTMKALRAAFDWPF